MGEAGLVNEDRTNFWGTELRNTEFMGIVGPVE